LDHPAALPSGRSATAATSDRVIDACWKAASADGGLDDGAARLRPHFDYGAAVMHLDCRKIATIRRVPSPI